MVTSVERKPAPNIETLRVPPHSIEAEQAVLGGLMLSPESWERVADRISEEDFYRRDHRLIFRAINQLSEKDQPCDAVTLGEWFESQGLSIRSAGSPTSSRSPTLRRARPISSPMRTSFASDRCSPAH